MCIPQHQRMRALHALGLTRAYTCVCTHACNTHMRMYTHTHLQHTHDTHTRAAGTTVTVALTTGWLLTVANAGDSGCVLDTGSSMLEMICSHRIHTSAREQARLKEARQYVASLGFHLQVWVGGCGYGWVWVWVCARVCVFVCVFARVCVFMFVHACPCLCVCACVCNVCLSVRLCMCACARVCSCVHVCACACWVRDLSVLAMIILCLSARCTIPPRASVAYVGARPPLPPPHSRVPHMVCSARHVRCPQGPAKPGEPGVGPLRIWPGGLCVARSVGDLDAGPEIVPVPHIRQVRAVPLSYAVSQRVGL